MKWMILLAVPLALTAPAFAQDSNSRDGGSRPNPHCDNCRDGGNRY